MVKGKGKQIKAETERQKTCKERYIKYAYTIFRKFGSDPNFRTQSAKKSEVVLN